MKVGIVNYTKAVGYYTQNKENIRHSDSIKKTLEIYDDAVWHILIANAYIDALEGVYSEKKLLSKKVMRKFNENLENTFSEYKFEDGNDEK